MKIGIMQPYFMPYIGYWQLMNVVDKFVVYDNIEYTKKSWIRRNRILNNNKDKLFSLPIKKDSDYLNINERYLSVDYKKEKNKTLNLISAAYHKAPEYKVVFSLINKCLDYEKDNLFDFIFFSINEIKKYLEIRTELIISSDIEMDHSKKNQERVIEICKSMVAKTYINPIGGTQLYSKEEFLSYELQLQFLKTQNIVYNQNIEGFVPNLSIIDVMMFNSVEEINKMLKKYTLI